MYFLIVAVKPFALGQTVYFIIIYKHHLLFPSPQGEGLGVRSIFIFFT
jgi:hypothetical protein